MRFVKYSKPLPKKTTQTNKKKKKKEKVKKYMLEFINLFFKVHHYKGLWSSSMVQNTSLERIKGLKFYCNLSVTTTCWVYSH